MTQVVARLGDRRRTTYRTRRTFAELSEGELPLPFPVSAQYLAETAGVCLEEQGHLPGVMLLVREETERRFLLSWEQVSEIAKLTYDLEEATEYGAYGLAILVLSHLTGLTVQRAMRGEGFDYWLGKSNDNLPFQNHGLLEVSGIRHGNENRIKARIKEKWEQVGKPEAGISAYVAVVEFGTPVIFMEKRV